MNTTGEGKHFVWLQKSQDQNKFTQTLCQVFVLAPSQQRMPLSPRVSLRCTVGAAILFQVRKKSCKGGPLQQLRVFFFFFFIYSSDVVVLSQKLDKDSL